MSERMIAKCLNCNRDYDQETQGALCPHAIGGPNKGEPWPVRPPSIEWNRNHLAHVQRFLIEMYQIMVDPVDEFRGNIAELCELLLRRAKEDREALHRGGAI